MDVAKSPIAWFRGQRRTVQAAPEVWRTELSGMHTKGRLLRHRMSRSQHRMSTAFCACASVQAAKMKRSCISTLVLSALQATRWGVVPAGARQSPQWQRGRCPRSLWREKHFAIIATQNVKSSLRFAKVQAATMTRSCALTLVLSALQMSRWGAASAGARQSPQWRRGRCPRGHWREEHVAKIATQKVESCSALLQTTRRQR